MTSLEWFGLLGAIGGVSSGVATVALVIIGFRQLRAIRQQIQIANEQTKIWRSVDACDGFNRDPIVEEATKNIWTASGQGQDYSKIGDSNERDVILLLNYLDRLAIAIDQGLYVEQIIKDYLQPIVLKAGDNFINNKSLNIDFTELKSFCDLYNRWKQTPVGFKAP